MAAALYTNQRADPQYRMKEWRQRAYRDWLKSLKPRPTSLLDVGCGHGESLAIARKLGIARVRGTEIVPSLCNDDVVECDVLRLTEMYPEEDFSVVTAIDVLEHLDRPQRAIAEMYVVASEWLFIGVAHHQEHSGLLPTVKDRKWWESAIHGACPTEESSVEVWEFPVPPIKQPYTFYQVAVR